MGVITRATLRLVPAPSAVRRFLLSYPDLATMLSDERLLVHEPRFEGVQGAVLAAPTGGWTFRLDAANARSPGTRRTTTRCSPACPTTGPRRSRARCPYLDYLNRFAVLERLLRSNGQWFFPHPWLTTFVGDAQVESRRRAASWPS